VNAPFAQDEDLLAAKERIHHDGPFFESCSHQRSLAAGCSGIKRARAAGCANCE
jgi:hypothetical protein